ncbi:hypothetical protein [Winogradskyella sp.]|uniref:hypothetical protein n=1 Tax=Winogradskyella sp. TaxID=1883156 RepID=UPI003BA8AFCB
MLHFRSITFSRKLTILIVMFSAIGLPAQIENIPINEEVIVDRLYAGLLSNNDLSVNTNNLENISSVQFGTRVRTILIPGIFQIRAFGVFKKSGSNETQFFKSYEGIFTPNENTSIHFGVMATPTTELRPNPTTWESQIETNAEKTIIGGRTGIKVNYNFSKNLIISYGLHNHDDNVGQHLKVRYKQFTFSSFIERHHLFFVAKWKFNQGSILTTTSKEKVAFSSVIPMGSDYKIYADLEHDKQLQKLSYLELGLRKLFSNDGLIKGFISVSYNNQSKSIQGGLFLHI